MIRKIAIPVENGLLCQHFGHCEAFLITDIEESEIKNMETIKPPLHEPGSYPRTLAELGVKTIIASGMGQMARQLFAEQGIEVLTGIAEAEPQQLLEAYLARSLESGVNPCTH
ncbi:MAG TPA: ATPase [Candidatus Marinimicrobia bacterium]|nr:ATPase [Candidatus Neomarinimicrobiota bacterium]